MRQHNCLIWLYQLAKIPRIYETDRFMSTFRSAYFFFLYKANTVHILTSISPLAVWWMDESGLLQDQFPRIYPNLSEVHVTPLNFFKIQSNISLPLACVRTEEIVKYTVTVSVIGSRWSSNHIHHTQIYVHTTAQTDIQHLYSKLQGGSNMTGTDLCVNKSQFVPVIFEPPCISTKESKV
jgi:hypothetical protein